MQPYSQSPAQNMIPQRPWWLIFGLSFGIGFCLIAVIYSYVVRVFAPVGSVEFSQIALYGLITEILDTLLRLLYLSACLVAGILVAGKAHRAGSATLASLLIGLLFLLSNFISGFISLRTPLLVVLLSTLLGIYVGFLGGLVGRTTERTRKTIGLFYAISAILAGTALILWSRGNLLDPLFPEGQEILVSIFVSMIIIGSLSGITAWILTLVQFARVHAWGPFTLTLFFSGIMILVYLIVGAQPSQPVQYAALSPGAYPPPVAGVYPPMQSVPALPPQADAITILQQRFARGEIDVETYRQMLATLTGPPTYPPRQ